MAEGAGLENRYTRKGIVGSNPTLSVLLTFEIMPFAPGDCLLTGLCGLHPANAGPPSGLLFLALALVLYGALGLWRTPRRTAHFL